MGGEKEGLHDADVKPEWEADWSELESSHEREYLPDPTFIAIGDPQVTDELRLYVSK